MKIRRRNFIQFYLYLAADLLTIFFSFVLAYYARFNFIKFHLVPGFKPFFEIYLMAFFFTTFSYLLIFYLLGLYDTQKKHYIIDEFYDIAKGILFGTALALLPAFFYRTGSFSRLVLVIGGTISFFLINLNRVLIYIILRYFNKKGRGVIRTAIVGSGEPAKTILEMLNRDKEFKLIGQIAGINDMSLENVKLLGSSEDIRTIVKEEGIDMLVMAFPLRNSSDATNIIRSCANLDVQLRFLPDIHGLVSSRIKFFEIGGLPLLGLRVFPLTGINKFIKRFLDITVSTVGLIFTSPLMLLTALGVKLTSPGPVFYRQERVGKDGKIFIMIKFRSMKKDAEKYTGPVYAQKEDSRKTRFGSFIRAASIDELPQLFNVIKGDMSLIGPRPEREIFVEKFIEEIPRYNERHRVKPGITGWAQANDLRANSSIEERVAYDLYYIENWSWDFDIKIMLRTAFTIFFHKNAY
ncbi:undecaprenyl-phosphate glucose phosphotransferase [candidate division WOR-3 bacterium]|nr:undecaprenyl-phosphate glucose phosphotransferase [candidate division WOR-3 bacterium]